MFESVEKLRHNKLPNNVDEHVFNIFDSVGGGRLVSVKIPTAIILNLPKGYKGNADINLLAVINYYSSRSSPIAKNVALYYKYLYKSYYDSSSIKKLITRNSIWIDEFFPEIEFGKKYHDCIARHYAHYRSI